MEAVRVGDQLFDADGKPCSVLAVTPVMVGRKCYRLLFSDGATIVADAEHQWFTMNNKERAQALSLTPEWRAKRRAKRPKRGKGKRPDLAKDNAAREWKVLAPPPGAIRTTKQIANTLHVRKRTNHSVAVCEAVQLPEAILPIDPYLLGAWLGDGTSKSGSITTADQEIVQAFANSYKVTKWKGPYSYGARGLQKQLRRLAVLGNKHVPLTYLRGSVAQRLALLQGLMDTDGTCDTRGQCEFGTTNPRLRDGVFELLGSLGIKTTIREGRAMLKGKDCGPQYRLKFLTRLPAFRLIRKLDRQKREGFRGTHRRRYIADVALVDSEPVRCITVDSPSGMFLAGASFIPTHNSDLILGLARTEHMRSLLLRRTYTELEDSLISRSLEFYGDKRYYNQSKHIWHLPDGKEIRFRHLQHEKDVEDHKSAQYDLIAFDELTGFTLFQYVYLLSRARTTRTGQRVRIVAGTNPGGEGNDWVMERWAPWLDEGHPNPAQPGELRWFRRDEHDHDVECEATHPDALSRTFLPAPLEENPKVDPGYRRRLALLPEPYRSQLMDGDWTAGLTDDAYQVIPTAWIRAAMKRWKADGHLDGHVDGQDDGHPDMVGIDVARGGADQTVLARRYGSWFAEIEKHPGRVTPDGASVAALAALALKDGGIANIDVIGVGSSAFDSCIQAGLEIYPVNFAEGSSATDASGTMKMINKRAEFYWRAREALDPKQPEAEQIALPNDPELLGDLRAPRWKMQSNGIQIESKEAIKKRIGRSPDCADAVVLAMEAIMPAMVMI